MQSLEEKHVCFIQSAHEVVGDPFVDTKENEESGVSKIAKRRAIVLGHQTMGKIAGITGTALLAHAAKPYTGGRTYVSVRESQLKSKGLKPQKNTVYFPERGPMKQIGAERKHWDYMHGKPVDYGPKKGRILRGDELRYYGRDARRAKVGSTLVAYSRIAKPVGYGHAYGLRPRGLVSPVDYVVQPGLIEQDARQLMSDVKRSHENTQRYAGYVAGASLAYSAMGGNVEGVATAALLKVITG